MLFKQNFEDLQYLLKSPNNIDFDITAVLQTRTLKEVSIVKNISQYIQKPLLNSLQGTLLHIADHLAYQIKFKFV